ncbi:TetR family transcriptional regulator [Rhodococcus sp. KBW08]|uniref:TetR/AcrR family transcriptional regulator n=1 Tax=Rhodococcus sp. KBW08 TaxID=2144188 RepID=UPI000F59F917|nr:TetR/AcrR family transcriptional regulator [Rhodococcus sp. KBW08]RQO46022.1 TetR family transcriptional regulator [Rhodococcus sp. KBW08]
MNADDDRHLRTDAARNAARIVDAARVVFANLGPDAPLEAIARQAGIGIRTLYRRFPTKEDLLRAVLDKSIAENLTPAIEQSLVDSDARNGLKTLVEASMSLVLREHNILSAASNAGALTAEVTAPFMDSITDLTLRAQQSGSIRADLEPEDMNAILGMLTSSLWNATARTVDWRRNVALVFDGLSPEGASPLPSATHHSRCSGPFDTVPGNN